MQTKKSWLKRLVEWYDSKQEETTNFDPVVPVEYINALTKMADQSRDREFLNSSDIEAVVVFYLMIRSLRPHDEVCIYSNALSHPFNSTILSGPNFLRSNVVCKIVLDDKAGFEIIKKLPEEAQRRINCRLATTKDGAHMIVTFESFRLEIEKFGDELFTVSNFYAPDSVEVLKKRFNRIWENSVPIQVG